MATAPPSSPSFPVCRECTRTDGAPTPHCDTCVFAYVNPKFDFSMQCLECLRLKRWNDDYRKGNVYCPGAPRVHNCGK